MGTAKISLVTFSNLSPNSFGPGGVALGIALKLYDEDLLHRVFCLGSKDISTLPTNVFCSPPASLLYTIISKCHGVLQVSQNEVRFFKERAFDYFVSRDKGFLESDLVLFLKPAFPRSVRKLQRNGKTSVAWASILHPAFNYKQVQIEEEKYCAMASSNYTNKRRVQYLTSFYDMTDFIIVQSLLAKKIYLQQGIPERKILQIEKAFGVDCKRFRPSNYPKKNDVFKVLHISNMCMIKGVHFLIQAWKNMQLNNAQLILAGTIDKSIQSVFSTIKPSDIVLSGPVANPASLYQEADVFVSPSISDLNPYTILEAMASGLPVISSNMCGASEIISHGVDGFVYRYDSVESLQTYIRWCFENKNKLLEMGKKSRKKIKSFQSESLANKVVAYLNDILNS